MSKEISSHHKLLYLLLIGLFAVLFVRFFFIMRGLVLLGISILFIAGLTYFLVRFFQERKTQQRHKGSIQGQIEEQILHCNEQIQIQKRDIQSIQANIAELRLSLQNGASLKDQTKAQTQKMIAAFDQQKNLRQTKLEFYQAAIKKLKALLENHQMQEKLSQKQAELKQLQETNFESVADLEEMKSNLEYQQAYIESVDRLSLKMLEINEVQDAQTVALELKTLSKEIDPS